MNSAKEKPSLVLHPGFPKSGSSSIQHIAVSDDFRAMAELGYKALGRGFRPNDGYPDVSRLMYDREACIQDISENSYSGSKYFLSNEAVGSEREIYEALIRRFRITRCVFSVREFIASILSNYKYSGWLSSDPMQYILNSNMGLKNVIERRRTKINEACAYADDLRLCAIEGSQSSFTSRFFTVCFDRIPSIVLNTRCTTPAVLNRSVGLAFSKALYLEMKELGLHDPPTVMRAEFVKAARYYSLPPDLQNLSIDIGDVLRLDAIEDAIEAYHDFLIEFKYDPLAASHAAMGSRSNLRRILSLTVASKAQMRTLRSHARNVLIECLPKGSTREEVPRGKECK